MSESRVMSCKAAAKVAMNNAADAVLEGPHGFRANVIGALAGPAAEPGDYGDGWNAALGRAVATIRDAAVTGGLSEDEWKVRMEASAFPQYDPSKAARNKANKKRRKKHGF